MNARPSPATPSRSGGFAPLTIAARWTSSRCQLDYELGRIQQSFADAAQLYPVFKNIPLAELIKSESEPPLADLRKSIDAKNLDEEKAADEKLSGLAEKANPMAERKEAA